MSLRFGPLQTQVQREFVDEDLQMNRRVGGGSQALRPEEKPQTTSLARAHSCQACLSPTGPSSYVG